METKQAYISQLQNRRQLKDTTMNAYLSRAVKAGTMERIRQSVYALPGHENKYACAALAVPDGVICYHSALEYHQLQTQVFTYVQIGSKARFRDFAFKNQEYKRVPLVNGPGIYTVKQEGVTIMITALERTLVDCIDRPDLCAGYEEIGKAFEMLRPGDLDYSLLTKCLEHHNKKTLWKKCGYIFDRYDIETGCPKSFLDLCRERAGNVYITMGSPLYVRYNAKWNLMAPRDMEEMTSNGIEYGIIPT